MWAFLTRAQRRVGFSGRIECACVTSLLSPGPKWDCSPAFICSRLTRLLSFTAPFNSTLVHETSAEMFVLFSFQLCKNNQIVRTMTTTNLASITLTFFLSVIIVRSASPVKQHQQNGVQIVTSLNSYAVISQISVFLNIQVRHHMPEHGYCHGMAIFWACLKMKNIKQLHNQVYQGKSGSNFVAIFLTRAIILPT